MNDLENSNIEYKNLIIRFLNRELSLSEEIELKHWINANADHSKLFEQYRNAWLQSAIKTKSGIYQEEQAWQKIRNSVRTDSSSVNPKINHRFQYFLKIAAIAIFIYLIGFFTSRYFFGKEDVISGKLCEISTPLGSKSFLVLPDGSQVWLNAGSKLTYSKAFDVKERKVTLVGEAYFKVTSNKKKPFIVAAGQMNVRAYGTSFNVKAYPDDKVVSATLVEGIVKVDGIEGKKKFSYTLKPSQNITIHKDDYTKEKTVVMVKTRNENATPSATVDLQKTEVVKDVKTELYTSWKDPRWDIEGEPLNTLAILLGRRFNTVIHIKGEDLNKYKFTGIIQNETLEQVLQFLSYTAPLNYEIGKGEVWWTIDRKKELQYSKILNNSAK